MSDLFVEIEDLIIARLESKLATLNPKPRIFPGKDFENIKDRSQGAQGVCVMYNGITSIDRLPSTPHIAKVTLEYLIWIVTRSGKDHGTGKGNRESADPIVYAAMNCLMGWRPDKEKSPLTITEAPGQVYADGFAYFPLAFTIIRHVVANPN